MIYKTAYNSNKIIRLSVPMQPTDVYKGQQDNSVPVFNTSYKHAPHIMGAVQSAFKALPRPFQEHFMKSGMAMSHPSFSKDIKYNAGDDRQKQFHDVFGATAKALSNHMASAYGRSYLKQYGPAKGTFVRAAKLAPLAKAAQREGSPFTGKPISLPENPDHYLDALRNHSADLTHAFLRHIHTNGLHGKPFQEQLGSFHDKLATKYPLTAHAYSNYMDSVARNLGKNL